MSIKVEDVMIKDVVYATVPGSRDDALKTLKSERISGVPVVKDKRLVGIVTRTDLLKHPEEEQLALIMTRNPITISPECDISDAAKVILEGKIRRLPVVTDDTLIGLITVADIVGSIADMNLKDPVEEYVRSDVVAIWDGTPLPVVMDILRLSNMEASPVLNSSGELVGIITERDLLNVSEIEDYVEKSDMSAASDGDAWAWEGMRDTMNLYYGVSRIKLPEVPVKEAMIKDVITAFHRSEISSCAKKMCHNRIDQLPIVTAHNKLSGLLLDKDLIRVLIK